jgi:UDP-2,3-diacylglucosamine hydrolase
LLEAFERFIDIRARHAHALYILGDLFEAWVGDDDESSTAKRVSERLKWLSELGVPVFYMHGNRDFLVGKSFLKQSDIHLLPDPSVVSLDGHDILMSHGDLLCTHDVPYQRYRWLVHRPFIQAIFLSLPRSLRRKLGDNLRMQSQAHGSQKSISLMDVDEETVINWFKHYQVHTMVHGHTHKPFKHVYPMAHPPATRFVLGAWDNAQAQILCYQRGEFALINL